MRSSQTHDGHLRRADTVPTRQFARALDCGGDGDGMRQEPQQAMPAARSLGTPRDGAGELDDTPPGAA